MCPFLYFDKAPSPIRGGARAGAAMVKYLPSGGPYRGRRSLLIWKCVSWRSIQERWTAKWRESRLHLPGGQELPWEHRKGSGALAADLQRPLCGQRGNPWRQRACCFCRVCMFCSRLQPARRALYGGLCAAPIHLFEAVDSFCSHL